MKDKENNKPLWAQNVVGRTNMNWDDRKEIKTVKDLGIKPDYRMAFMKGNLISEKELKAEFIKWAKEDKLSMEKGTLMDEGELFSRWMKRLNITEEDLK